METEYGKSFISAINNVDQIYRDWHYNYYGGLYDQDLYELDATITMIWDDQIFTHKHQTGLLKFQIKENNLTYWFFEQADSVSFSSCADDQQQLKIGRKVKLTAWKIPPHHRSSIVFIRKISFHHIPIGIKFVINYSDSTTTRNISTNRGILIGL